MPKYFLKHTKDIPRKGYCRRCGRFRNTEFHHFEYRAWAPSETIIEVCWNCHVDLDPALQKKVEGDKKLQKYRSDWTPKKTVFFCYVCSQGLEPQGEIPTKLFDGRVVSFCSNCNKGVLTNRSPYR